MKGLIKWYEDTTGTKVSGSNKYMGEYTEEQIEELNDEIRSEVLEEIGWL